MVRKKRSAGRPALPATERQGIVPVRFPPDLLSQVDAIVKARLDRPNRSAVVRELVAEALGARTKGLGSVPPLAPARPHVDALLRKAKGKG